MAGAGFEPAKAEPWRLQRHPFDRSGTPPGVGQCTQSGFGDDGQRVIGLDFVGRVLRAAEPDAGATVDRRRRNEPTPAIADMHEEVVAVRPVEMLHEATPALVSAPRGDHHLPTAVAQDPARLY